MFIGEAVTDQQDDSKIIDLTSQLSSEKNPAEKLDQKGAMKCFKTLPFT